jgi:sterol desaturase/sphingolipid hydroxylase (fatty acid hydroxylase superfamily)
MRSLRASWEQSSLYRIIFGEESERTDLYLYLYYCFSLDRFVVASLGLLGPFFIFGLLINGVGLGLAKSWPPLAQFVAYVLLSDFLNYWFHRIAHTAPSLWELHKFHHGATSMNFITAHRNHPMEVAMQLPIRAVPIVVLGPGVHDYLLYTAVHHLVILLQHSNFNVTFGMLERVFVSPRFHLVHHSMKPEHFDKNFGVVFSFWDDLFRTRYTGADSISTYGVTGNYFNRKGFAHDLRVPFVRFGKALFRRGRIV